MPELDADFHSGASEIDVDAILHSLGADVQRRHIDGATRRSDGRRDRTKPWQWHRNGSVSLPRPGCLERLENTRSELPQDNYGVEP